jgi:hypothetical protein
MSQIDCRSSGTNVWNGTEETERHDWSRDTGSEGRGYSEERVVGGGDMAPSGDRFCNIRSAVSSFFGDIESCMIKSLGGRLVGDGGGDTAGDDSSRESPVVDERFGGMIVGG